MLRRAAPYFRKQKPKPAVELFGSFPGTSDSVGGALAPDGKIYSVYYSGGKLLELDPVTKAAIFYNIAVTGRTGHCLASNGKIYAPGNNNRIAEIDPVAKTVTLFGSTPTASPCNTFNLAPDGKLYGMPRAGTAVVELDPITKKLSYHGSFSDGGTTKYHSSILGTNGKIYGIPATATRVAEFDPVTKAINFIGSTLPSTTSNTIKWESATLADNGKIYCIPRFDSGILVIDPAAQTTRLIGGLSTSYNKWHNTILGPDGLVYGIPFYHRSVLQLNPADDTIRFIDLELRADAKFWGAVLAPTGNIIGLSFVVTQAMELINIGTPAPSMFTLPSNLADLPSSDYNKHQNK